MATIGGASLLPPCVGPASIAAVALSAIAMRANTEHGFASVAASRSKQDFWHADDNKPPLRSGDDADGSLLNRRVIKKRHFLMRGDRNSAPSDRDIRKELPDWFIWRLVTSTPTMTLREGI